MSIEAAKTFHLKVLDDSELSQKLQINRVVQINGVEKTGSE